MTFGFRRAVVFLAGAYFLIVSSAAAQQRVTGVPGDVVRVEGTAVVFGKTWDGLVGIDLGAKPGTYPMKIGSETRTLSVLPRGYFPG